MRFEHEDVREGLQELIDERLQQYVPRQVADAWLATVHGVADAFYVTRLETEPSGARWVVLAVKGRELVVIEGTSSKDFWDAEDADRDAQLDAQICTRRDVKALRLREASDANRGRDFDIRARWALELVDGRSFTIPTANTIDGTTRERAEGFIAAVRALLAD